MLIADSQVHVWAAPSPEHPWPPGLHEPHRPVPLGTDDLLREMDAAGVDRAVLIPPTWDGGRNDLALAAAKALPDRFAVMARVDGRKPGAREVIDDLRRQPGMLGLRFSFVRRPQDKAMLSDGSLDWLWAYAEESAMPVMMMVAPPQLHIVDGIAQRHPGLRLVMDHLSRHGGKDEAAFGDLDKLLALARLPNVAVKASALPAHTADEYPYRRVFPYIRRAYDAFGPQRVFWGTDLSKLPCTYRQAVTMFTEEIPWLTQDDKEWIMGRGLCEWLGWKLPQA